MTKLAHYCCDPRFHKEPNLIRADGLPCVECNPNFMFYGSQIQAEQKRDRILATMQKAEGRID